MKIQDTRIGRQIQQLGESIANKADGAAQADGAAAAEGARAADKVAVNDDGFDPAVAQSLKSESEQLKQLLDQASQLMGDAAVRELRNSLPKAALAALEQAQPALPLLPGKGVYASFRAKMEQLLKFEGQARGVSGEARSVVHHSVYSSNYSHGCYPQREMIQARGQLKAGRSLEQVRVEDLHERGCGRPGRAVSQSDLKRYVRDIHHINERIQSAWPYDDIPASFLLQDEYGRGPGTGRLEDLGYGTHMPSLEEIRAEIPGYVELQKEVTQLRAHLREAAFPGADEIQAAKAQLMNGELSLGEMHQEVATLMLEVGGMADSSEIKREVLRGTHKSRTESHGESFSRDPAFGLKLDGRESHSVSMTSGSSTSEQLNLEARSYEFKVVPNLEGATLGQVEDSNFISLVESGVALEKLLRARRVYEAMVALEPNSPETQGLKMFMAESTFAFKAVNDDYKTKDTGVGQFKMDDLRADLLKNRDSKLYPDERYDFIKQEIQEGPPRPPSKLQGGRSLSDL